MCYLYKNCNKGQYLFKYVSLHCSCFTIKVVWSDWPCQQSNQSLLRFSRPTLSLHYQNIPLIPNHYIFALLKDRFDEQLGFVPMKMTLNKCNKKKQGSARWNLGEGWDQKGWHMWYTTLFVRGTGFLQFRGKCHTMSMKIPNAMSNRQKNRVFCTRSNTKDTQPFRYYGLWPHIQFKFDL